MAAASALAPSSPAVVLTLSLNKAFPGQVALPVFGGKKKRVTVNLSQGFSLTEPRTLALLFQSPTA